ncbi:hypothetical protein PU629_10310 [Pullulanibacillus sp. KACC 23026]|uniref:hypothetical protein n=1 Tax=Pullulanibacillus sp. KACC 23026 TaxID=3028315 RepID=UPI0023AF7707|nr:hypothetical protein [Pullulanibacillus sp. KACC 23026]WEG14707.1 hypothetical protein PU629_10310 [Pullulanibacillus sp. KACC 23026]
MILYEQFDKNEIYILVLLIVAYGAFFLFPKKLPRDVTLLFLLWGFASSTFYDFTIGGGLLDFYKVNDSNRYELFDLLTYFSFSTFSYFYVYFYELFKIKKFKFIAYVIGWAIVGLLMERLSIWMGVIHLQHGYNQYDSSMVFLITLTTTGLFYRYIKNKSFQRT